MTWIKLQFAKGATFQVGANSRRHQPTLEDITRYRSPSPSTRSTSPPNSVDAFAEPRRRERANTFGSKRPSDLDLTLKRTVSGGSYRRRPVFDNASVCQTVPGNDVTRPEEDVCFPADDVQRLLKIDYKELEDFVAECGRNRPSSPNLGFRNSAFDSDQVDAKLDKARINGHISTLKASTEGVGGVQTKESCPDAVSDELDEKFPPPSPSMLKLVDEREFNRFSFFSSEIEHAIHAPEIGDLLMPGENFRDLFDMPTDNGAWWLDVMNPTEAEMEMFQQAFGIHRLTAEDIEQQETREKVELFPQYYFVCFRSFYQMNRNSESYLDPVNVYMVVFREGILTFTYAPSPHASEVRKRIGKLRNYINLTADWICYAMV